MSLHTRLGARNTLELCRCAHAAPQSPQEQTEVNSSAADKWAPAGMETQQRSEPQKPADIKVSRRSSAPDVWKFYK